MTTVRQCNPNNKGAHHVTMPDNGFAEITPRELGLVLMGAVMITTYFTEAFKMTRVFGVPFLLILSAVYYGFFRKGRAKASNKALA